MKCLNLVMCTHIKCYHFDLIGTAQYIATEELKILIRAMSVEIYCSILLSMFECLPIRVLSMDLLRPKEIRPKEMTQFDEFAFYFV